MCQLEIQKANLRATYQTVLFKTAKSISCQNNLLNHLLSKFNFISVLRDGSTYKEHDKYNIEKLVLRKNWYF